jgi:hypothetical protein
VMAALALSLGVADRVAAPWRMRTTNTTSSRTVYTTTYGNGARTSSLVSPRFPERQSQQGGWRLVHPTEQFRRTIRRGQQKIVGDPFEIVRRFLSPAKPHQ